MSIETDLAEGYKAARARLWPKTKKLPAPKPPPPTLAVEAARHAGNVVEFGLYRLIREAERLAAGEAITHIRGTDILSEVCTFYGRRRIDVLSQRRTRGLVEPRQVSQYLCQLLTALSTPQIGLIHERDHTTILHAVRAINKRLVKDDRLKDEIQIIIMRLAEKFVLPRYDAAFAERVPEDNCA